MEQALFERITPLRQQLQRHPLYSQLQSFDAIRLFMSQHVFAVWDFMSLLKALQQTLSCVTTPWVPTVDPVSRRFINEIVLAEESDALPDGRVVSHFEWYYQSMKSCGANTSAIDRLLLTLQSQAKAPTEADVLVVLQQQHEAGHLHASTYSFLQTTWRILANRQAHQIAAAFTLGREDIIPVMFHEIVSQHQQTHPELLEFVAYLERHIALDGDSHGPLALRMLSHLCGHDAVKWEEATEAAEIALKARLLLWDGIAEQLKSHYAPHI